MSTFGVIVGLLTVATVLSAWRTWRARHPARVALVVLQAIAAVLLAVTLMPPPRSGHGEVLRVLTAGATPDQVAQADADVRTVALPGIDADAAIERVPDLGTALRRYPRVDSVHVVGGGLPARDRDAARGVVVQVDAAPALAGIVDLDWPARIDAGSVWRVRGRIAGIAGAVRVELRDRADGLVGTTSPDEAGRFVIDARAKSEGASTYTLRVLAGDTVVDRVPVGIAVDAGERVHVLLLAGAIDAEWKYLRRWASDAGIDLRARMTLSRGIALRDGELRLDADTLRTSDLVVLDERSWAGLSRVDKDALLAAVDGGLGLLLRVTGPVSPVVVREWAEFGWRLRASDVARTVYLPPASGSDAEPARVQRRPFEAAADDAVRLIAATDGAALAAWRAHGRGRTGVWWLADTYPLVLGGDATAFGMLWREALITLARARATTPLQAPRLARVDLRTPICGIGDNAAIRAPDGTSLGLSLDPATPTCAAFWPAQSGWHDLVDGDRRAPFLVLARDEGLALERADNARATRALADTTVGKPPSSHRVPGLRWPWFLAWLIASSLLWWLERRRPHP